MSVIGLRAGPYEIVAPAAIPGAGSWYVARRKAAIRTVPERALLRLADGAHGAGGLEVLRAQYNVLRTIHDPRIPTPIGLYEDVRALAMTLVTGMPLTGAIQGRRQDDLEMIPATLLDILLELAEALARAHGRHCHHGHLDPDHVWLTDGGSLWILGFGQARMARGPVRWLAPEQARGTIVGVWTDQWSLAALGTALISGRAPWTGPDPHGEAQQGNPEPALSVVAKQWPALGKVFRKMLDPVPRQRFASLSAARQELAALARQASAGSQRRALGAWLSEHGPFTPIDFDAPPGPRAPSRSLQASTMILDPIPQPQRPLAPTFDVWADDAEPTALTELYTDTTSPDETTDVTTVPRDAAGDPAPIGYGVLMHDVETAVIELDPDYRRPTHNPPPQRHSVPSLDSLRPPRPSTMWTTLLRIVAWAVPLTLLVGAALLAVWLLWLQVG